MWSWQSPCCSSSRFSSRQRETTPSTCTCLASCSEHIILCTVNTCTCFNERRERRKKEASKVKQTTRQSNTAHPRQSLFLSCLGPGVTRTHDTLHFRHVYIHVLHVAIYIHVQVEAYPEFASVWVNSDGMDDHLLRHPVHPHHPVCWSVKSSLCFTPHIIMYIQCIAVVIRCMVAQCKVKGHSTILLFYT